MVTAVMNHLAPPLPPSTQNAPSNKRSEPVEQTEGLYNFAPLAVVTSSNPTARPANVLVDSNQLFQRTKVRNGLVFYLVLYSKRKFRPQLVTNALPHTECTLVIPLLP